MLSGILRVAILLVGVTCLTVSKAFVKSNEKTRTYWLVDSIVRTVCSIAMIAAAVEPDGRNQN